ncbi:MAG: glycoside hydrolase family 130 protein [Planctomycetota bacterium]
MAVHASHESRPVSDGGEALTPGGLPIRHLSVNFRGDPSRVVLVPFGASQRHLTEVFDLVAGMGEAEVEGALDRVMAAFSSRHARIEELFDGYYGDAAQSAGRDDAATSARRRLIGAYFTAEYSLESAALFNPSLVIHPDQTHMPPEGVRVVLSLRAVGEGHRSSVVFRTGCLGPGTVATFDPPGEFTARAPVVTDKRYNRGLFRRKLGEMVVPAGPVDAVLGGLPEWFTLTELESALAAYLPRPDRTEADRMVRRSMLWLAYANYEVRLEADRPVSDLVLFPRSASEARGIEDLRLVRFREDDGATTYYGTYTGFDGTNILPLMLDTPDFHTVNIHTLNGACIQNKGLALFPRRIGGRYAMCGRIDGRNLYLMYSDNVYFWHSAEILARPRYPWEFRLIGNCGSPLETPEGWLLITHGVGPMRRYCIGAMLLDLEDPSRIRGRLPESLLAPAGEDREGYVPNVVYSCGSLIHAGNLWLPYAVSDTWTRIAVMPLDELLDRLIRSGP